MHTFLAGLKYEYEDERDDFKDTFRNLAGSLICILLI